MKPLALVLIASLASSLPAVADTLVLADGARIEGKLVEVTFEVARIKVGKSVKTYPRADVAKILKDGKEIENPCPFCRASGSIPCRPCRGSGKAPQGCKKCDGEAHFTCEKCDGKQKKTCKSCRGRGKKAVFVQQGRRLVKKIVDCPACRGYGWKYCSKCKKKGFLDCRACKGTGKGSCAECSATGLVKCPLCSGSGDRADERRFLPLTYLQIEATLDDRRKSDEEKEGFFDGLMGKRVFWTAVVVGMEENETTFTARLNLDPDNVDKVKSDKGWEVKIPAPDLVARFSPTQRRSFRNLQTGSSIWLTAVLAADEEEELMLEDCEIVGGGEEK
ncbi:MAG: hypothetical protein ACYTFG_14450 [Planctomycetota bacterium]|jgi:hypothetical protein